MYMHVQHIERLAGSYMISTLLLRLLTFQIEANGFVHVSFPDSYPVFEIARPSMSQACLFHSPHPETDLMQDFVLKKEKVNLSFQTSTKQNTLSSKVPCLAQHRHHVGNLLRHSQPSNGDILHVAWRAFDEFCVGNHARLADHRGCNVVDRDPVSRQLKRQVLCHAHEPSFRCCVMAPIDPSTVGGYTAHEYYPSPLLRFHVWHG